MKNCRGTEAAAAASAAMAVATSLAIVQHFPQSVHFQVEFTVGRLVG